MFEIFQRLVDFFNRAFSFLQGGTFFDWMLYIVLFLIVGLIIDLVIRWLYEWVLKLTGYEQKIVKKEGFTGKKGFLYRLIKADEKPEIVPQGGTVSGDIDRIIAKIEETYAKSSEGIKGALLKLKQAIDQESDLVYSHLDHNKSIQIELDKYRIGFKASDYDSLLKRLFLMFESIRLSHEISPKAKEDMLVHFNSFLFNYNVFPLELEVGQETNPKYVKIVGKDDNTDSTLKGKISVIVSPGYVIREGVVERVIEIAKVRVYA